jgi:heptosyltransferase-2
MEIATVKHNRILVIQTAFPGDAILTLPMIQMLKRKSENIEVEVLCIPSTKEIFESSPYVNSVVVLEKLGAHRKLGTFLAFVKSLKSRDYSKIICPHRSFRSALIVWMLGKVDSYGFSSSSIPYIFKNIVNYDVSAHEVQRNLELIGFKYEGNGWRILPEIIADDSSKIKVNRYVESNNLSNYLCIAPGSVWQTKRYPVESFRKVINFFSGKGYEIVLTGGTEDKSLCEELVTDRNVFNVAGLFSLTETAELLKSARMLICNDSAPTHLGMCADIPVLTIYCSTVPAFGFYPYNSKSDYVSYNNLKCKPCGIHGHNKCPVDTFDCGFLLNPEAVINKALILLNNNEKPRTPLL